jgi:choline monooxygenase
MAGMKSNQRDAPIEIHEDIRKASTLPSRIYSDPAVLALQRERVFAPSWQLVSDTDRLRVPGQVQPATLLEGCLDEPLLLTRDAADKLHCISNVCTHRGNLVCESEGVEHGLRCRYHGRRFGLDGKFQAMPEFDQTEGFPSEADSLPQIALETWKKLIFVSLAPSDALEARLGDMIRRCGWMPLEDARFDANRSRDYLVQANWALYCDNYLEGFHIPFIHAGLAGALDYGSYRTELFGRSSLQLGVASSGEDVFDLPGDSPDHGQRIAGYYWWVYPNLMFNIYPWGLSVNVVKPLAVDRTRVSYLTYVWDPSRLDRGAGSSLDRVEREDEEVVESVQRGVSSRLYDRGRYSPAREQGVHHFHRLLAKDLSG